MSLLILNNIRVENANAIAGFTYGFPAITQFLGYVHALSRKLSSSDGITLGGCAVMCHEHQIHAYRENSWSDYSFALTRNPLTSKGETAPIIEEGRMHLTVSLIIECEGSVAGDPEADRHLCEQIKLLAQQHKLAGGRVSSIERCYLVDRPGNERECRQLLRPLLPGFLLVDRSDALQAHAENMCPEQTMLESWLDFIALKYQAVETGADEHGDGKTDWERIPKPEEKGYLVPIMIGYRQISELYPPGKVANARDAQIPFAFTEAVFSVGEWVGSPSKITDIGQILWRYHYQPPYYLCRTPPVAAHDFDLSLDLEELY